MEYPFILGTAGHIDHGKTALVKAITGIDCDRLEEEKRRGITIELGFAPLRLPDGKVVSIVDVPGHERFIRQMAAGASGMDAAMLIIAAPEGVMPQTREHLAILSLLGVKRGLVALTKKDLADAETLELAQAEAAELIQGSGLEGAAIIPVSALTGEGLPALIAEIGRLLDTAAPRQGFGAFFLPVDRVFSKKGFGSVVTGTAYQGSLSEGAEVELLPAGGGGRVRSLQTHGAKTGSVRAGQRAAINLAAVSPDILERGAAVCAKGAFIATECLSAHLEVLPAAPQGIAHWQRVRLHVGTVDAVARISLLRLNAEERNRGYPPGTGGPVQLLSEAPIAAAAGQRFVIRLYSPLVTIGGGRILLPNAVLARGKADREAKAALLEDLAGNFSPAAFLAALVRDRGLLSAQDLETWSQMDKAVFSEALGELSQGSAAYSLMEFGKSRCFIAVPAFDSACAQALRTLRKFHGDYPELAGLDGEKLCASLADIPGMDRIASGDSKELLGLMAARGLIARAGAPEAAPGRIAYRLVDFQPSPDDAFIALVGRVKDALASGGFNLLKAPDLEEKLKLPAADIKRAAAYLREREELWTIGEGLLLSRDLRDKLLGVLASMREGISVAALRDALGVNRKYALAMLDFLDSQGLTRRDGDIRLLV
jgi:selenocysteine-specific elongation factor